MRVARLVLALAGAATLAGCVASGPASRGEPRPGLLQEELMRSVALSL
jgi:hypothetical protein